MRTLIIISTLALSACGISDGTALADLSADDGTKICEEYEPRTVTCDVEGFEFTVEFATECDTNNGASDVPEACDATVGDFRDCFDAWSAMSDEEICASEGFPAECGALFSDACVSE